MSHYEGFPPHDPRVSTAACGCWSCSNGRLVSAEQHRNREARRKALEAAADIVVTYIHRTPGPDVYAFEQKGVRMEGTLAQVFREFSPSERPLVDAFEAVPMLERYEILTMARDLGSIRIGDMTFSKERDVVHKAWRRR